MGWGSKRHVGKSRGSREDRVGVISVSHTSDPGYTPSEPYRNDRLFDVFRNKVKRRRHFSGAPGLLSQGQRGTRRDLGSEGVHTDTGPCGVVEQGPWTSGKVGG